VQQPAVSLISRGEIARFLSISRSLELARIAYAATATGHALHSSLGHVAAPDGEFHIKGSGLVVDGRLFAAVKVAAYFPERTATLKLPSIVGLIQLFDGANGQPLAVMESELITKLRTAAGTAAALDQLARADARRLLVCGTGAQALPHIEAVAAIRDLESVQLWGRSPERAQATLAELRERFPDLQTDIAQDVSAAARRADLIVCLTSASKPYVHTGDVRPGTTIAAVGSDTPEKQELSTELLASATLVCDVTHQCAHAGELHHALEAGVITLADVRGEIGEVIAGQRDGRRTQDEIVVFDSTGTAVQDTAPAAALYLATKNAPKADLWAMN
jgi:alanine dehydrogenase